MALSNCGECGYEMSTTAKYCPNCGAKMFQPDAPRDPNAWTQMTVPAMPMKAEEKKAEFYVLIQGEAHGPFDMSRLRKMYEEKTITNDTLCAKDGDDNWKPIENVVPMAKKLPVAIQDIGLNKTEIPKGFQIKTVSSEPEEPKSASVSRRNPALKIVVWVVILLVCLYGFIRLCSGPSDSSNTVFLSTTLLIIIGLFSLGIYFLPTIAAYERKNRNAPAIFIINFFFGWTLLGWVIALVWAIKKD